MHSNLTLQLTWECRWQCVTGTRSMDSHGWEFLDFLDQASWCHAGMAGSSWLHRCGMGCHRHWCWGSLWTAGVAGTTGAWLVWVAGVAGAAGVSYMCYAGCGSTGGATEKWCLVGACGMAVIPLGTVLTTLTLHSWRCLHTQWYVEPLLVCTW